MRMSYRSVAVRKCTSPTCRADSSPPVMKCICTHRVGMNQLYLVPCAIMQFLENVGRDSYGLGDSARHCVNNLSAIDRRYHSDSTKSSARTFTIRWAGCMSHLPHTIS